MAKITERSITGGSSPFDKFKKRYDKAAKTLETIQDFSHGIGSRTTALESNIINTVDTRNQLANDGYTEDEIAAATAMPPSLMGQQVYGGGVVSHAEVLKRWETPEHDPANAGFMGATKTDKERMFNTRVGEIEQFHEMAGIKRGRSDAMSWSINRRKKHFNPESRPWYGRGGHSLDLIQTAADKVRMPFSRMRRVVAINSPNHAWDQFPVSGPRAGQIVYPNIETAEGVVHAVQGSLADNPGDYERALNAAEKAPASHGGASTGYPANRRKSAPTVWGEGDMSETIVSDLHKVPSFDVALSNPTSSVYGYSPHVERHILQSHTADTWDAGAMAIKEKMRKAPTPDQPNRTVGAISGMDKPFHAKFLEKPSGYDIATATAKIAAAELFNDHYKEQMKVGGRAHADSWAQANAWRYEPAHFQSNLWDTVRAKQQSKLQG